MKSITVKFTILIAVMIVFIASMLGGVGVVKSYADAVPVSMEFDKIDVMSDLNSMDGFSLIKYSYDPTGKLKKPEVINVVEYCYSPRLNARENYGVYVYFYDPQASNFSDAAGVNKITLATEWTTTADETVPARFEKYELELCSRSDGDLRGLFYKFKVVDRKSSSDGKTLIERVNSNERRYDISELELRRYGDEKSTAYKVGASCRYTGYAKGYGPDPDAESTLACRVTPMTTISLDVKSTIWRSGSSSVGPDYHNQLNSVYFAVPEEYFVDDFKLRKIHAEWYEYATGNIFVTTDGEFAKNIGDHDSSDLPSYAATWGIHVNDLKADVTPGMLTDYIYAHTHSKSEIEYLYPGKNIPKCLFDGYWYNSCDVLTSSRTQGYNDVTIDAGDSWSLFSYDDTHSFWDKVHDFGFWNTLLGKVPDDGSIKGIEPIHIVKDGEVGDGSAKNLFISENDVDEFNAFYADAKANKEKTVLFRFAATDYYSAESLVENTTVHRTVMFFDFDIIDLTFDNGEITKVVPVAASPIDIVGYLQFPTDYGDDAADIVRKLLGTILAVLLLLVIILTASKTGILKYLIDGIVWLVTLPFKAISALFKRKKDKKSDAPPVNVTVNLDKQSAELERVQKNIETKGEKHEQKDQNN